jgi:hypothetical protein
MDQVHSKTELGLGRWKELGFLGWKTELDLGRWWEPGCLEWKMKQEQNSQVVHIHKEHRLKTMELLRSIRELQEHIRSSSQEYQERKDRWRMMELDQDRW